MPIPALTRCIGSIHESCAKYHASTPRACHFFLILAAMFFMPRSAASDLPEVSAEDYFRTTWSASDGLPAQIRHIAQDRDGALLLASDAGLVKFDGNQFVSLSAQAGFPSAAKGGVTALDIFSDGSVWIGVQGGKVAARIGKKWVMFRSAVPMGNIWMFEQDIKGRLWAGTDQGLFRLQEQEWTRLPLQESTIQGEVEDLVADKDGTIFVRSDNTIYQETLGSSRFEKTEWSVPEDSVVRMDSGPDGRVYLTSGRQLRRLSRVMNGPSLRHAVTLPIPSTPVQWRDEEVLLTRDCAAGLCRLADLVEVAEGEWRAQKIISILPDPGQSGRQVLNFLRGSDGLYWIGTSSSLVRFRPNSVRKVPLPADAREFTLASTPGGEVWVAFTDRRGGGFRLQRIDAATISVTGIESRITTSDIGSDGTLWLAGGGNIWKQNGGRFERQAITLPGRGAAIGLLVTEHDIWVRRRDTGLFRFRNGQWLDARQLGLSDPLLQARAKDSAGNAWLGFVNGTVVRSSKSGIRVFGTGDGLNVGAISSLYAGNGIVIVVGVQGAALFNPDIGRFNALNFQQPELVENATGSLITSDGELWFNGKRGLVRISASQWSRAKSKLNFPMSALLYDVRDGLPGTGQRFFAENALQQSRDGRLWFLGSEGLGWTRQELLDQPLHASRAEILSLAADRQPYPADGKIALPAGTSTMEIGYRAINLRMPERMRYQYMLEGFNKEWQDTGSRNVAYFSNLAPGTYSFRVRAANERGTWGPESRELHFSITPAFHQTILFYVLAAGLILLVATAIMALRGRQIRRQIRNRLEERHYERERIARELHDSLLQGVQGLVIRLHVAAADLPPSEPVRSAIESALIQADEVISESREHLRGLRSTVRHADADLETAFSKLGEVLSHSHPGDLTISVTGVAFPLSLNQFEELYRIGREALSNAFQHSGADSIELSISYNADSVVLAVRDDGRGIEESVLKSGFRPGHWGFSGMRERARAVGAKIEIRNRLEGGAEIVVRLHRKAALKNKLTNFLSLFATRAHRRCRAAGSQSDAGSA